MTLNEPNLEYPAPYTNALWPPNPSYMSSLAQALRQAGDQAHPMYLSFPGPGGVNDPNYQFDAPNSMNWKNYWDGYRDTILTWYDDIGLHCYAAPTVGATLQSLKDTTYAQVNDIQTRFPSRPIRLTEYGITLYNYGGITPQNRQTRATDYASYMQWVRSGWSYSIRAAHVYLADNDPNQTSSSPDLALSDSEAQTLANLGGQGCVGQSS